MATVVCNNLFGSDESFSSPDMSTKLKLIGTDVCSFGKIAPTQEDEYEVIIDNTAENVYKKLVISMKTKQLLGGILVGDGEEYNSLIQLYKNQTQLTNQFTSLISPQTDSEKENIELPDDAQICSCEDISKKTVCESIKNGNKDLDKLKKCTKAGTGCGGCVPLVTDILKKELSKAGESISSNLCEHFKFSRVELFKIIEKKKINDFNIIIKRMWKWRWL